MYVALSHPEADVSSSCVPVGRAPVLFCSGLEVSVGAVGVEPFSAGAVVVGVLGPGVIGVELLASRWSPSRLSPFLGPFVSRWLLFGIVIGIEDVGVGTTGVVVVGVGVI